MPKISIISLIIISTSLCVKINNPIRLNPEAVKSPGDFTNKAPEATNIITPEYAAPKINAHVTSIGPGLIQKTENVGVFPVQQDATKYNPFSGNLERVEVTKNVPLIATTESIGIVKHEEDVLLNLDENKVIPPADDNKAEKKYFGIDRVEGKDLQGLVSTPTQQQLQEQKREQMVQQSIKQEQALFNTNNNQGMQNQLVSNLRIEINKDDNNKKSDEEETSYNEERDDKKKIEKISPNLQDRKQELNTDYVEFFPVN